MHRPARALVPRTLLAASIVGGIVGMVATFGARNASPASRTLRNTSRAISAVLGEEGELEDMVRQGRLEAAAVIGPSGELLETAGDDAIDLEPLAASCRARGTEHYPLRGASGRWAWCTGLPLLEGHRLLTVATGDSTPASVGLSSGLFAFSLTGLLVLWLWVPAPTREPGPTTTELGERDKALGRLAMTRQISAIVAHEVRNPLQSLTALIDVMAHEPDEGRRRELQEALQEELETIEVVVRRLVDSGDTLEAQRREVELEALLEACLEVHRPHAAAREVRLTLVAPRSHHLLLDAPLVRRAVENLVVNALDALEGTGGQVEVSVEPTAHHLHVHVDDDGPGVPPAQVRRLFDAGTTTRSGGTGLGLFLASQVASAHRGALECGQSPLGGARFTLTLPRSDPA